MVNGLSYEGVGVPLVAFRRAKGLVSNFRWVSAISFLYYCRRQQNQEQIRRRGRGNDYDSRQGLDWPRITMISEARKYPSKRVGVGNGDRGVEAHARLRMYYYRYVSAVSDLSAVVFLCGVRSMWDVGYNCPAVDVDAEGIRIACEMMMDSLRRAPPFFLVCKVCPERGGHEDAGSRSRSLLCAMKDD